MGDIVELTTWPGCRNLFYSVSSGGFMFEVKGAEGAIIGLAKALGNVCDYWVIIGQNNSTIIKRNHGAGKAVTTPNIINNTEYKKFWLTWKNGSIELGRSEDRMPILIFHHVIPLNYVTFTSDAPSVVFWKFEVPPILLRPRLKPITGGELQWVPTFNQLPDGALIGGYENETLYIIRAQHRGSLTPGKFVPSEGQGYIPWGGRSNEKIDFEVLCGIDCTWVPSSDDRIPVSAVEGGCTEDEELEKLYVGRGYHKGCLIPGKVQPSHGVCYIPYEEHEIALKKYEILVSPHKNMRCANRVFVKHLNLDLNLSSDDEEDVPFHPDDL